MFYLFVAVVVFEVPLDRMVWDVLCLVCPYVCPQTLVYTYELKLVIVRKAHSFLNSLPIRLPGTNQYKQDG